MGVDTESCVDTGVSEFPADPCDIYVCIIQHRGERMPQIMERNMRQSVIRFDAVYPIRKGRRVHRLTEAILYEVVGMIVLESMMLFDKDIYVPDK